MDVKLSSSSSSISPAKQFDFCDDLSEHGYGSLEDLNCPTAHGSPMVSGCDVSSSSSLPNAITTTTLTSSSPSSTSSLSSSSSIDSIASFNNSSSPKTTQSTSPVQETNSSLRNVKTTGDQDSDNNNNAINCNSPVPDSSTDNSLTQSIHRDNEETSGETKNDPKTYAGKAYSLTPQIYQSGNRFRFVPQNRLCKDQKPKGTVQPTNRTNTARGPRKSSRSESDCVNENRKRSQMRPKSNEDIVFIIKKVDRSLRRTVSESSGETLPVRGILKYPRGWTRRTLSESNCDTAEQSNFLDSHENGQTQSLECISPLEASGEASTESASSSAGESLGHEEEKPKKSVHFNCYVSKATFNINSTILNNKHQQGGGGGGGGNKKKNRRQNSNNPSSNHTTNNDHKNTSFTTPSGTDKNTTTSSKQIENLKPSKNLNQTLRWKLKQSQKHQCPQHPDPSNNQTKANPTRSFTDPRSIHCDAKVKPITTNSSDQDDQSENVDPLETKMRSRQDSGYDSETSERRGLVVGTSGETTCVQSPNRQFTVKKVDLN